MASLKIQYEEQDNRFRIITQIFTMDWLLNTIKNKAVVVVILRALCNEEGKNLFSHQEIAKVLCTDKRQTASRHIQKFKRCGEDFYNMLHRKEIKIDEEVLELLEKILQEEPLLKTREMAERINKRGNREDITQENVRTALKQISCKKILTILRRQWESGQAHYKESEVIARLVEMVLENMDGVEQVKKLPQTMRWEIEKATKPIEVFKEKHKENQVQEEGAIPLFEGEVNKEKLLSIWESPLGWKLLAFILYFQGVSQSAIGRWLGVNKSTICRWLKEIANWSSIWRKTKKVASSAKMAIDEKWIKIAGKFWYLFVAVDCMTGYPLHVRLYPSNSEGYCKLFLLELRKLGYSPKVIVTDGHDPYIKAIKKVFPKAEHLLCCFHVLKSVFRRFRKAKIFDSKIAEMIGNIFRTSYKRTVQRRIARIREKLVPLKAVDRVLGGLDKKLPQLLKAVGSTWRPSTSNAVEGFYSRFEHFYKLKGPFCDETSAQKHVDLFLLGYLLTIGAQGQPCPLEKSGEDVAQLPLYHLLNRPNVIALKDRIIKQYRQAG